MGPSDVPLSCSPMAEHQSRKEMPWLVTMDEVCLVLKDSSALWSC